jgi:hypothetical protein
LWNTCQLVVTMYHFYRVPVMIVNALAAFVSTTAVVICNQNDFYRNEN